MKYAKSRTYDIVSFQEGNDPKVEKLSEIGKDH